MIDSTPYIRPTGCEPAAVRVRVRASYLGSRWVQAPIADRRRPDI